MQEFLLQQVKERRINEELAWLYGRCLLGNTFGTEKHASGADAVGRRKKTAGDYRDCTAKS